MRRAAPWWVAGAFACLTACGESSSAVTADRDLDLELGSALAAANVTSVPSPVRDPDALVELGRLLFFDKVLSGNQNIACSTCHHLAYHSTDMLTLGIGTGGFRNGTSRRLGTGRFVPRNTSDLYNKGLPAFGALFHDGRVGYRDGRLESPAVNGLPPLRSALAAQAMFPVAGRDEMRGYPGDTTRSGAANELALLDDASFELIWAGLTRRLLAYPEYLDLFLAAFPGLDSTDVGFEHAAEAIAAFERAAFTQLDAPFDRYLAGDRSALTDSAKRGALLFYGRARCAGCHGGALLTDQQFHNIGVPQLGPGQGIDAPLDIGRAGVTGRAEDRFAFRTPSLRNVLLTGPWMHNGAYATLESVVRHYRDARAAYRDYDPGQLDPRLVSSAQLDPATQAAVLATLDTSLVTPLALRDADVPLIIAFLKALTDPAAFIQLEEIPDRVPSGFPVRE